MEHEAPVAKQHKPMQAVPEYGAVQLEFAQTVSSPLPSQSRVMQLQRAVGNAATQRLLAGSAPQNTIQRDPVPRYAPPAAVSTGRLPRNTVPEDLGAMPNLADDLLSILPEAFQDPAFTTASQIRTALNPETLAQNFNAYNGGGGGPQIQLNQCWDWIANYDSTLRISATVSNVRFMRADGVQIGVGSTSGVGVTGGGSSSQTTGVTGGASGELSGEGGKVGASTSGTSTTAVGTAGSTTMGGGTQRTVAPNASALFSFDTHWTVTVNYRHSPRTWNAIMSLGTSSIYAAASDTRTVPVTSDSTEGRVRIPVVDCIELPAE
jgi:hypothetical protein